METSEPPFRRPLRDSSIPIRSTLPKFTKYAHYIVHGLSCTREKDEIIQSRLKSFHTGIHKRRFVQERQKACICLKGSKITQSPQKYCRRKESNLAIP